MEKLQTWGRDLSLGYLVEGACLKDSGTNLKAQPVVRSVMDCKSLINHESSLRKILEYIYTHRGAGAVLSY